MILEDDVEIKILEKEIRIHRNKVSDINNKIVCIKNTKFKIYAKECFKFMEYTGFSSEKNKYKELLKAEDYGISKVYKWIFVNEFKKIGMFPSLIGNILKIDRTAIYYYFKRYKSEYNNEAKELKKQFEKWKEFNLINPKV